MVPTKQASENQIQSKMAMKMQKPQANANQTTLQYV